MDFFEQQALRNRQTWWLILGFLVAVIGMIVMISTLCWAAFFFLDGGFRAQTPSLPAWYFSPGGLIISGLIVLLILFGAMQRALELRKGGAAVAIHAGATPAVARDSEPQVKRFINIAEEMSIASGTPTPRLFILSRETGINAFVAGTELRNTVLVVTEGALHLERDALQGIVAHEFSHIAHQDLTLNARLLMLLGGLMFVSRAGRELALAGGRRSAFALSTRRRGDNSLGLLGIALMVCGWAGVSAGRLLQAAISRKREFLADASAVQYTRNPQGIAKALDSIRQSTQSSHLTQTAMADELNHMCISESLRIASWYASHPPLQERIRLIDPGFERRQRIQKNQQKVAGQISTTDAPEPGMLTPAPQTGTPAAAGLSEAASAAVSPILLWAASTHDWLVRHYGEAIQQQGGAQQLLLGFLNGELDSLPKSHQLPFLEWLIGGFKELKPSEREDLVRQAATLLSKKPSLSACCYLALLEHHLTPHLTPRPKAPTLRECNEALSCVLSLFARLGRQHEQLADSTEQSPEQLFHETVTGLPPRYVVEFQPKLSAHQLGESLRQLGRVSGDLQRCVLACASQMVEADDRVTRSEYELLRVASEIMGHPMPPLLGEETLTAV